MTAFAGIRGDASRRVLVRTLSLSAKADIGPKATQRRLQSLAREGIINVYLFGQQCCCHIESVFCLKG